ncbi:hypothetical protein OHB26_38795 (plasmid) [Nocardia sp. NBC_01503]|uniref:hypothetical protein n=1 Tax=Nocardia sp. NBC_01503 TaxID=2975997 RepID=UPI002E7AD4DE|nr:hypothetical protein [Nocardia sp. NBC_01503]WTL36627.1 hypothetical protein OHB26_38795 [Nocardia sp. NBC_01503]
MVNTTAGARTWHGGRGAALLALLLALVLIAAPSAVAQNPDNNGGNYGFGNACDELQSGLDGIGLPFAPSLGDVLGTGCDLANAGTHPGDAVQAVKDKMWDSTFGKAVDSILSGLGQVLVLSMTFWMKIPNSKIADSPTLFAKIRDYTFYIQIYLLMASVIYCATKLAIARRSATAQHAEESFWVLFRTVVAAGGFSAVIVAATKASDGFSSWVVSEATDGSKKNIGQLMVNTSAMQAFSPGLVLIIAILGILGAFAQVVFAIIRQGFLIIVVGIMPMAAAGSGFEMGKAFYRRFMAWTIAFVLWKPVAAIVYLIAFTVADDAGASTDIGTLPDSDTAQRALVGLVLLCSVAAVLPAVMRLASPVALAASNAGGGMAGVMTGAMMARGRRPSGATDSRGGGRVRNPAAQGGSGGGANPPTGASSAPRQGPTGPRGPAGTPGRPGAAGAPGRAGAAGRNGGRTVGPAGVTLGAGMVAAQTIGKGVRAAHSQVDAAASPQGNARTPAPRPTGARRGVVPR